MVAYVDDFRLMMLITLGVMPLLLLMRTPKYAVGGASCRGGLGAPAHARFRALTVALAGCAAVGPNFKPPAAPDGEGLCRCRATALKPGIAVLSSDARPAGAWWRGLGSADSSTP